MFGSPLRQSAMVLVALLVLPGAARAQTGATLTPNLRNHMVNKDIAAERWTINLNLASDDPNSVINVTGNIFRADGGPPGFVLCQVRPDSSGTLTDPSSTFRLTCHGADACRTTATRCAREDWTPISDDVQIPASFFLPPAGLGSSAGASSAMSSITGASSAMSSITGASSAMSSITGASSAMSSITGASSARSGLASRLGGVLVRALSGVRGWLSPAQALPRPRAATAGGAIDRGATLSLDRLNFLVNKDVGAERWSISLNFVPVQTSEGGVVPLPQSVTGNVFQPDGSPPSFIFCTQRGDSSGTLEDPSSEFRLACQGTSACDSTARDCAATRWTTISDDVRLPASFFLPPEGLPATPASDPEIVVIGRTSDPPSIITGNFSTTQGAAAERPQGACPTGTACFVPSLGSCEDVRGRVVEAAGVGCGCFVENVPSQCIGCGDGASGQCGGECGFPVGGARARGECLPFSPDNSECACYAIGAGEARQAAQGCGGPTGAGCVGDRCCSDDPRDGCDPFAGGAGCFGICVAVDDCDPSREQCGSCLSTGGQFCGNGDREGSEECDGSDLAGQSCSDFGFGGGGRLRCTARCGIDTGDCAPGGNEPPVIVDVTLPSVVDPNGGPVDGIVRFADPDGDIVRAIFTPVSGNIDGASFDPGVFGRASGSFDFFVDCRGNVADFVLALTLEDQQGNRSEEELVAFSCRATAACGNGILESGETCDPPGSGGGCGSGFLCTNDCSDCVSATSCEGRCGPGRDDFCTPPDAPCYCDEACRGFADCCSDVSFACGF